jgi:hypothetical protein
MIVHCSDAMLFLALPAFTARIQKHYNIAFRDLLAKQIIEFKGVFGCFGWAMCQNIMRGGMPTAQFRDITDTYS